jgi:5-aminolevulinate synthase
MSQNPAVVQAMVDTAFRLGTGSGGTRNIGRTNHPLVELERELARLHVKEEALVLTSGYVANQSSVSTIAKLIPNNLMLSDELNHNSMIEGVNQSNCAKQIFRRNDRAHLEQLPQRQPDSARNADRLCNPDHADLGCRNLEEGPL